MPRIYAARNGRPAHGENSAETFNVGRRARGSVYGAATYGAHRQFNTAAQSAAVFTQLACACTSCTVAVSFSRAPHAATHSFSSNVSPSRLVVSTHSASRAQIARHRALLGSVQPNAKANHATAKAGPATLTTHLMVQTLTTEGCRTQAPGTVSAPRRSARALRQIPLERSRCWIMMACDRT